MPSNKGKFKLIPDNGPEMGGAYFDPEQRESLLSHREKLKPLPDDETAVQRIIGNFIIARLQEIEEGLTWYQQAAEFCRRLYEENVDVVTSVEHACGIVACLSPRISWVDNKKRAEQLVKEGDVEQISWAKSNAKDIMGGVHPKEIIFAPGRDNFKVQNFYRNLSCPADPEPVTIDVHAWSMIYGLRDFRRLLIRTNREKYYWAVEMFQEATRRIAAQYPAHSGIVPCQVQAVTWVVWKATKFQARNPHQGKLEI